MVLLVPEATGVDVVVLVVLPLVVVADPLDEVPDEDDALLLPEL